ncbi:LytR C-terminal domain-containing protein [Oerskovia sp. M15]
MQVRVFNGSGKGGLAAANADILASRDFTVVATDDLMTPEGKNTTQTATQISFGATGIAQAYTLAAHYESPILVLDDRADATVDLVLGKNFENLVDEELVGLDTATPLESRAGCAAVETITPQPAYVPPAPVEEAPVEEAPAAG